MGKFSSENVKEFQSYMEACDPMIERFCPECGEECKTGQMLLNGWVVYEDLYHFDCAPAELKSKLGIK